MGKLNINVPIGSVKLVFHKMITISLSLQLYTRLLDYLYNYTRHMMINTGKTRAVQNVNELTPISEFIKIRQYFFNIGAAGTSGNIHEPVAEQKYEAFIRRHAEISSPLAARTLLANCRSGRVERGIPRWCLKGSMLPTWAAA